MDLLKSRRLPELLCFSVNIFVVYPCCVVQWCTDFFCVFSCFFCAGLQFDFIPERPHQRAKMSKGLRKNNTAAEDLDGASGSSSESGSDMMAMLRVLMEEQRKSDLAREEARRAEEERKETVRVERELEERRKQFELQTAMEARQYEQQVALMRIQAEMGEKASRVHREGQSADRKRDRALYSISVWKEGEDLEEFLLTA